MKLAASAILAIIPPAIVAAALSSAVRHHKVQQGIPLMIAAINGLEGESPALCGAPLHIVYLMVRDKAPGQEVLVSLSQRLNGVRVTPAWPEKYTLLPGTLWMNITNIDPKEGLISETIQWPDGSSRGQGESLIRRPDGTFGSGAIEFIGHRGRRELCHR